MSTANTTSLETHNRESQSSEGDTAPKAPAVPKAAPGKSRRRLVLAVTAACIVALGGTSAWYWWQLQNALPPGIAMANGRLESEQVEIATKYAGRVAIVLAREGQMVDAGEVVARMDIAELEAQLHAAEAQVDKAGHERTQAEALIVQRNSERTFARQELQRTTTLIEKGWSTREQLDQRQSQMRSAQAAYDTAAAALESAKAQIATNQAEVARLKSQINDSTLVAPRRGRIQYQLTRPGEVLPAGGRVLTILDVGDVYVTIFVPAHVAGSLTVGDEARVVFDPIRQFVFPAKITFVATEAQFTPKTVETPEEREKLMFRVKLTIDPGLAKRYEDQVKTGVRGVGFVRAAPDASWPDRLSVKLP